MVSTGRQGGSEERTFHMDERNGERSETALETKEIIVLLRKASVCSVKLVYRWIRAHPFVWSFVFFLVILHRYHPSLFGFVMSSTPVIVCTALLLGTILVYGDANVPETGRERNTEGLRNIRATDNGVSGDEFSREAHMTCKSTYSGEGFESDAGESSSPDASVSDIIPMLDELHPLLDSDAPQLALQESDDGSVDEEIENQEDEEDEAQDKDDANEQVVKWTADDQKNLMDLGTSELERNQRLENLIAKRRARKFLSFHGDKNLIDLDSNDPVPSMEDVSRFNFQVPSISAPRRNPFDIPFEEETMGLPPIPGSAPSVLQPRRNPFDIPYDQGEENSCFTNLTMHQHQFVPTLPKHMFFQGQESFVVGTSSSADTKADTHASILKPYFASESLGFTSFPRESLTNVTSKNSSAQESDTSSSDMDQEDQKELVESEMHPEMSLQDRYVKPVEHDGHSSEEVDSIGAPSEQNGIDEVGMGIRRRGCILRRLNAGSREELDVRYDGLSSSSSESGEKCSKMGGGQIADPVYDSSPSAVEKSHSSRSAFDDALLLAGKDVRSDSALTSDVQINSAKDCSGSAQSRLQSDNEGTWVAPSSLSFVDEIESKSREINEIKELDVIRVEVTGAGEDFSHPVSPVLSKFVLPSRLSLFATRQGDSATDNGTSSKSTPPPKPLTPREVSMLQVEKAGLDRHGDLSPIPEESLEYA